MPQQKGRIVLIILAVATAASLWRTVSVGREKRRITDAYAQAQQMVNQLESERSHLNEELSSAKTTIEQQVGWKQELDRVRSQLETTMQEIAVLRQQHEELRAQNSSLVTQLSSVTTEKEQLETKLSDLKELRLAIHEVKRKMNEERWAAWRARIQALKQADQARLAAGNRGFLVRNGTSTMQAGTKLQVHVLEPQSE